MGSESYIIPVNGLTFGLEVRKIKISAKFCRLLILLPSFELGGASIKTYGQTAQLRKILL